MQTHPNNGEFVPLKTYPVGIRRPTISNGHGNCVSRESRKTSWFKSSPSDGLTLNAYLSPLKQTLPVFFSPPTTRQKGGAEICCDARTAVGSSACVADICCEAVSHVQLLDLQPVLLRSAVSHVQLWIFSLWCYHHVFFLSSFARSSHLDPKRTRGTFCSSHTFTIRYKCRLCSLKVKWRLAAWRAKSKVKPADVNKAVKTSGTETLSTEYPTLSMSMNPSWAALHLINFQPYCKRRKNAYWRSNWSCSIWQERGGPATPAPCQCLSFLSNQNLMALVRWPDITWNVDLFGDLNQELFLPGTPHQTLSIFASPEVAVGDT